MWIEEIAAHLEQKAVTGAPAMVHIQTMPPNVSSAVMLAGGLTGMKSDPELPGLHKGRLQMVVRATKSLPAEELAQALSDALETGIETPLDKIVIRYIHASHLPIPFPKSGGDYYEAVVNFDLCFVRLMA